MSVGLRPAAQSSNPCKARRYPERARRSAASIWACSSSGISSKVVSGIVGLLDIWVLGYIQHIIRAPHCANLMHSDLVSCSQHVFLHADGSFTRPLRGLSWMKGNCAPRDAVLHP